MTYSGQLFKKGPAVKLLGLGWNYEEYQCYILANFSSFQHWQMQIFGKHVKSARLRLFDIGHEKNNAQVKCQKPKKLIKT